MKEDTSKAYCAICKKTFRFDGSRKLQVTFHHKSHSIKDSGQNTKKKPAIDAIQQVFQPTLDRKISMREKTLLPCNHAEQVFRAEIYQALHVVHSNYSSASTQGESKRFKLIFRNCPIVQVYA